MNKDLTEGNIRKNLWLYTLPLLGSVAFQLLYNLADIIVAGNFIGENALAAVGNASEITLIYTAFAFGCNVGCSVITSQLFGAKKYKDMKTAISTAFIAFSVLCVFLMIFGFSSTGVLLKLIKTDDSIFADSYTYLMIYTASMPFVFFYNVATGVFSALGDSKTPFIFLAISSITNIFVDIIFVKYLSMGVSGVAWATFLCQGISCILAVLFLIFRLKKIETEEKPKTFSKDLLNKLIKISIPSILQQGSISIGNLIVQSIINDYGVSVVAGYTASIKLISIATSSFSAVGSGLSTFVSQNIGANKPERIMQGYKNAIIFLCFICVPLTLCFTIFGTPFIQLFMKKSATATALATGVIMLQMVSPFYIVVGIKIVNDGILRGSGSIVLFMISTSSNLIIRVIMAFVLSPNFGIPTLWWAWGIGWTVGMIVSFIFLLSGKWKKTKLI